MCGIVGYIGKKSAAPYLLEGLQKLEYRGYDSAGIAVLRNGEYAVVRRKGRVKELEGALPEGNLGIGHTRWATHGEPSERNAHPHVYGKFAVVHNGIIENFLELKEECVGRGEKFSSETDSEVVAHLLNFYYKDDFLTAVKRTTERLSGSFALAILCLDFPDRLIVTREKSPLLAGRGPDGVFAASDLPAIAEEKAVVYSLSDGEFAVLSETVTFYDRNLNEIVKEPIEYDYQSDLPDRKGYRHYMRKEISEIPQSVANSTVNFAQNPQFSAFREVLCQTEYIHIVACGTAYHSGIAGKIAIEALARIPVEVSIASEYRYQNPIVRGGTLAIAVSQSGETADTLAAAERAKAKGATLVAITNAPYSSLTRIADFVLETHAGREIAVAATKSYNAQLAMLYSLAVALAEAKGRKAYFPEVERLSALCEECVKGCEEVRRWTPYFTGADSVYFLGRGADYVSALEGSLKLKEISYLPSEGYPAGELKHGTLALIEPGTPVVAVLTQSALAEKTMNAVHEVYARGGKVFLITSLPEYERRKQVFASIAIPECAELFSPVLSVIPLQALAYYTSIARGNDPDKPRNLAKSVTVE